MCEEFYTRDVNGKGLSLHELLEELDDIPEYIRTIAINPPFEESGVETDENSDLSDIEARGDADHLPRRVLEEFISEIVVQSNIYAAQKGNHKVNITAEEIKVVFGFFSSEYHSLPSKQMYWKVEPD
ncbi:hypothetical protein ILUMI_10842, partial [Ignelater luminosus]